MLDLIWIIGQAVGIVVFVVFVMWLVSGND